MGKSCKNPWETRNPNPKQIYCAENFDFIEPFPTNLPRAAQVVKSALSAQNLVQSIQKPNPDQTSSSQLEIMSKVAQVCAKSHPKNRRQSWPKIVRHQKSSKIVSRYRQIVQVILGHSFSDPLVQNYADQELLNCIKASQNLCKSLFSSSSIGKCAYSKPINNICKGRASLETRRQINQSTGRC